MSRIPHHTYLHSGRNVYLTSWFILSVLFLPGGGTSVVPTCVRDLPSHGPPRWKESLPDQLVHSVCVVFDRREDVCGPYMCLGSAVTWTSTPVWTSTQPAGSFCLYCFWQAMRCMWSLSMSGIPHHTDLHSSRNVFLTNWFILTVLFLIGDETSVVPRRVWHPPSHRRPPWEEHLPDKPVHAVCVVFDMRWHICGPYMCLGSTVTQTSTQVGTSTWPAGSFCLYYFSQAIRCLWSLQMYGIPHHTDLHPSRNVYLTSWFILAVLFLTGGETSVLPTYVWDPPSHGPPPW